MGLGSEMKNLSEELLASFKQRIKDNEELVNEVQSTLDHFRSDHMEMASVLNANANALRKGLAKGEKDRLNTYKDLMSGIHRTISSIQKEVTGIQTSTFKMVNEFSADRAQMARELNKFFSKGKADRKQNEKTRMNEFDALMDNINDDIKNINAEVAGIFKNTNDMLDRFEKEHTDMADDLRAELGKNLAERVEYTRTLLKGFQKRLSEISKENQKMAHKLRKDLDNGETERLSDYNSLMKGIHLAIKSISSEVKGVKHSTSSMLDDLLQNRVDAAAEWGKMQKAMAQIRKKGPEAAPKEVIKKVEKNVAKKEPKIKAEKKIKAEVIRETHVKPVKPEPVKPVKAESVKAEQPEIPAPPEPKTLEERVLLYINKHPKGVKISEMEIPLGQSRMRIGFIAKALLDQGKVLKLDNIYYPIPKTAK
ncbi:MAG: hypothetical protein WCK92_01160 [Bacteroidota bacterium]